MWKHVCLAIAGLVAAAWAPMAAADAQGTARMGTFVYTLFDMNPNDGIAPSLVFDPMPQAVQASGATSLQYSTVDLTGRVFATGTDPLLLSVAPVPELWVSGSLSGRTSYGTLEGTVAAHASSSAYHSGMVSLHTGQFGFVLSPHTQVTFSTTFEMEASATGIEGRQEYFYAEVWMSAWMDDLTFGNGNYGGLVATFDGHPRTLEITEEVSFSAGNMQAVPQHGFAYFMLDARAYSDLPFAPPIPEPGQLPMLGAGLLVLGAWAGRGRWREAARKRRSQPAGPA